MGSHADWWAWRTRRPAKSPDTWHWPGCRVTLLSTQLWLFHILSKHQNLGDCGVPSQEERKSLVFGFGLVCCLCCSLALGSVTHCSGWMQTSSAPWTEPSRSPRHPAEFLAPSSHRLCRRLEEHSSGIIRMEKKRQRKVHLSASWVPGCSVTQSCLTLIDQIDYSLSGSSVRGILQARIPE